MKTKQNYSVEFRAEAVKLVLEQELSQGEAASRLGIPKGTLANWVVATPRSGGEKPAPGARTVAELEAENARLRKELADARMERDIVKKAAAYFARGHCPVRVDRRASGAHFLWQWPVASWRRPVRVSTTGVDVLPRNGHRRTSD